MKNKNEKLFLNRLKNRKNKMDEVLNPSIEIEKVTISKDFTVKVVRDDLLVGGTKQRALYVFFNDTKEEYIYASPVNGYAQIALAYVAGLYKKKATVFLASGPMTDLTKKAKKLGAKIVFIKPPNRLKDIQSAAAKYALRKENRCLLPFGLGNEEFAHTLAVNIKKAWGRKRAPKRMWVVAGSATILKSLSIVFPDCFFLVLRVGKRIWPDQLEGFRNKLYTSPLKFYQKATVLPPYPSVETYDAKLWEFVLKEGQDGDYVWNVGRD